MDKLKYCKIRKVKSPVRGTDAAAGIDFFVPTDIPEDVFLDKCDKTKEYVNYQIEYGCIKRIALKPGQSVLIPSGIKMKVPDGHALVFFNKSGVGSKKQLSVLASVVDYDYQGEVHINVVNTGLNTQYIEAGDKIVQGLVLPINFAQPEEVEDAETLFSGLQSARGECGFGSTGAK